MTVIQSRSRHPFSKRRYKLIFALAAFFVTVSTSHANEIFNARSVFDVEVLITGEQSIEVKSARGNEVYLSYLQDSAKPRPEINVADQFGGFECELWTEIKKIDANTDEYSVTVSWSRGADYSGCIVQFRDPVSGAIGDVEIYMSY